MTTGWLSSHPEVERLRSRLARAGRIPDNWLETARRNFMRRGSEVSHWWMEPDGGIGYVYIARRNGSPSVLRIMEASGRVLAVYQGRRAETLLGGAPLSGD